MVSQSKIPYLFIHIVNYAVLKVSDSSSVLHQGFGVTGAGYSALVVEVQITDLLTSPTEPVPDAPAVDKVDYTYMQEKINHSEKQSTEEQSQVLKNSQYMADSLSDDTSDDIGIPLRVRKSGLFHFSEFQSINYFASSQS